MQSGTPCYLGASEALINPDYGNRPYPSPVMQDLLVL
jgi:hypothetical protein